MTTQERAAIVIEDEIDIAKLHEINLRRSGFDVRYVGRNEEEFLNSFDRSPDNEGQFTVILDERMPGSKNGSEMLRTALKQGLFDPTRDNVIVCSASANEPDVLGAYEKLKADYPNKLIDGTNFAMVAKPDVTGIPALIEGFIQNKAASSNFAV
jgi:DNA-binding response OmpR family regulator